MKNKITFQDRLERLIVEDNLRNSRITKTITSAKEAKRFMQKHGYKDRYNDPATLDELEAKSDEGMIEAARRIRQKRPVAVVRLTRLDCIEPRTNEHRETSVRCVELYDLDWLGANQIILIGRDSRCDLRPFLRPLEEIEDLHKEGVPTDMEISELHGIIFWKRGKLFYKDRSVNGSTENDDRAVMNNKVQWDDSSQFIGLGQFMPIKKSVKKFRLNPQTGKNILKRDLVECRKSRFKLWWSTFDLYDSLKGTGEAFF